MCPAAGRFSSSASALVGGVFPSSARFVYESNAVAAGQQNGWKQESYRIECAEGTLLVDGLSARIVTHERGERREYLIPQAEARLTGHRAVLSEFVAWVTDGQPPATPLDDNVETAATMFAAVDAAERRSAVAVADYLEEMG